MMSEIYRSSERENRKTLETATVLRSPDNFNFDPTIVIGGLDQRSIFSPPFVFPPFKGEKLEEASLRAGEEAQDRKSRSSPRWIPARRPE